MKFAIPVIVLLVGLAIGAAIPAYFTATPDPQPALPDPTPAADAATDQQAAWDTERGQLQARIQELDQAVVDRDRIISKLRSQIRELGPDDGNGEVAAADGPEQRGDRRRDRDGADDGDRRPRSLADLKERDPEAYERIRERIEGFTTRMQTAMLDQHQFFETLDQALMNEKQLENHLKLQETLLKIQKTIDQLNNGDLDNADGWQTRREVMGALRDVGPLLDTERETALGQIAQDLGYETAGEQEEFVNYMDHVYKMTSPGTLWRSMMGGGRGDRDRNNNDNQPQDK